MNSKQMILGVALPNNFGAHPAAWRMPHIDPQTYTDLSVTIDHVQAAERGRFDFVFMPDRLYMHGDVAVTPPVFNIDPIITLAAVVHATKRIGLVATASTSFTEPYLLARQLKALDVISNGRIGWNAVPSYESEAFANMGRTLPPREKKYERLHEAVQIVQALWGSWGYGAGAPDQAGKFADPAHIEPINMRGTHVAARGPLPVPPSKQGQPVVVMPASSGYGLQAAGMYANIVIGMPQSIEQGRAIRATIRQAAEQAGRDPDEVRLLAFVGYTIADTQREALDIRRALDDRLGDDSALARLGAYLGLREAPARPDEPFTEAQLAAMRAHPQDPRSENVVELARAGWSPRDILAHAPFDPYPSVVGTAEQVADHLQQWFEAGVADGFMVNFDDFPTGVNAFADRVVPVLRKRGIVRQDYQGSTLRDHLGLPAQYGLDPRIAQARA